MSFEVSFGLEGGRARADASEAAFDPSRAVMLFVRTKDFGLLSGVLLAITGVEALFAKCVALSLHGYLPNALSTQSGPVLQELHPSCVLLLRLPLPHPGSTSPLLPLAFRSNPSSSVPRPRRPTRRQRSRRPLERLFPNHPWQGLRTFLVDHLDLRDPRCCDCQSGCAAFASFDRSFADASFRQR